MNIKIQCACGSRYSFDVEPRDGQMPYAVQCPTCRADGTAAANQLISESIPAPASAPEPSLPPPPAAPPLDLAAFRAKKRRAEETAHRKGARRVYIGAFLTIVCLAAWVWYAFYACKPHLSASIKISDDACHIQFLGPDRILIASHRFASLRHLSLDKTFWGTTISASPTTGGAAPEVFDDHGKLWICTGDQLHCLDAATGSIKQTIPITGRFVSFTPSDTSLLVVSEPDETRRIALRVDRATGAVSTMDILVPRSEKQAMPNDLPPSVLPTAAVLTAQILEQQKFNKPLDAMSSEFFSSGQNLVELRVKLLTAKVSYVESIKPRGPSQLNGQTTAGSAAGPIATEIFNDLKRSQTGGVRAVDESTYDVRLRRWIESEPVEWHGQVIGAPAFFPLASVDLLVAGPNLTVFDKQNNKLFESKLQFPLDNRFTTGEFVGHLMPAAERSNTLYFFDQGVLTAFSLPSGEVRWRLTSFGVSDVKFDDQGLLYVDTTKAAPEDVKYADTINFDKIPPVILKVDPANGKILWKSENRGERTIISGPFVYSESVEQGGVGMANALASALDTPGSHGATYFHLYRLDPETGVPLWTYYREEGPLSLAIERNRILLHFGQDLELLKFLSF